MEMQTEAAIRALFQAQLRREVIVASRACDPGRTVRTIRYTTERFIDHLRSMGSSTAALEAGLRQMADDLLKATGDGEKELAPPLSELPT